MKRHIYTLLTFLLTATLSGEGKAKIDAGPVYVHLDILESGKTVDRMDMPGIRADASYIFENGIALKPTILYASNRGSLFTVGASIGQYIPLNEQWSFLPNVGIGYGYVRTSVDFPEFGLHELRETFRSVSPFLGLDAYYSINPAWRICGSFQYAWSRTHTDIKGLGKSKSNCQGPIYALLLENDLTPSWSLNLGIGYNISLTKEKHGIRGTGIKLGLARWF